MDIRGHTVHEVWIEERLATSPRSTTPRSSSTARAKAPLVMLSTEGGMDIEEVAESDPDAIARLHVDPLLGFQDFHGRRLAFEAGVDADVVRPVGAMLAKLYDAFVAEEAMLVEVNPLIVHRRRARSSALDAKVTLDDNALYRHPENAALRDPSAEDPQEQMAKERGLTYVKLDGDIGILGNGAGLVMSHARRRRAGRRRAGELPRRRRRLEGRGDHQRGRGDPLRPEGQGRAVQHLRRHHPLRRGRQRPDRGVRPDQARRSRSSCASTAPTTSRAASCWPRPSLPERRTPRRRWTRPPRRSSSWRSHGELPA